MKNNKKLVWVLVPVVIIIAMVALFMIFKPGTNAGSKTVAIQVVDKDGATSDFSVKTDAEYLRQAMEETKGLSFAGDESEYGMMVTEVNGIVADFSVDGAYWAFYVNDEYCQYGIDQQPVADGDAFRIEYTVFVSE